MKIVTKNKMNLGDTLISDQFILNYINFLELIDIKVYIFLQYLYQKNEEIPDEEIAKRLNIGLKELYESFDRLVIEELLVKHGSEYILNDLKETLIDREYTKKPVKKKNILSKAEQIKTIAANTISEAFFNGIMPFNWYADIGIIIDKYKFEGEVMVALFQHCNEKKALNQKYVYAVAEDWHRGGVKTFEDLEKHLEKKTKLQTIMQKISKSLRLNRLLTKYEEVYVKRWTEEFEYDFDIIDEALKRTVEATTNPTFNYINAILNNWHKAGYKTLEEINQKTCEVKKDNDKIKKSKAAANTDNFKNYEQREYKDLEAFYDN